MTSYSQLKEDIEILEKYKRLHNPMCDLSQMSIDHIGEFALICDEGKLDDSFFLMNLNI